MSWSTRIDSAPNSSGIFWITSPRCSVSSSGSPAAGSSRRTTRGSPTTARATSTRRRSRAPSPPTFCSRRRRRARRSRSLPARRARREERFAPECSWIIATFSKTESFSIAMLGLERPPQPPARPPVVGHLEQVLAEGGDDAGRRLDESAQDVEERRLAGAVRADQPARAAREDDAHVVDRGDAREADGQAADLDHAVAFPRGSDRTRATSSRPRFAMSFGNCSARPPGAVSSTWSSPTPKRIEEEVRVDLPLRLEEERAGAG